MSLLFSATKGNINFDCLHIEKLFSLNKIARLLNPKTCKTAEEKTHALLCYQKYRTYDGTCNNLHHKHWGSADVNLERMVEAEYTDPDKLFLPKGSPNEFYLSHLPLTSLVSHTFIGSQKRSWRSHEPYSHAVMQWGQFLDHDLGLSPESVGADKCLELQ